MLFSTHPARNPQIEIKILNSCCSVILNPMVVLGVFVVLEVVDSLDSVCLESNHGQLQTAS